MLAVIVLAASALTIYVACAIPLVTAALTKVGASSAICAVVTAVLMAVNALLTSALADGTDIALDRAFVSRLVVTVAVAIGTYYGFWKPTGIAPKVQETIPGIIGSTPSA